MLVSFFSPAYVKNTQWLFSKFLSVYLFLKAFLLPEICDEELSRLRHRKPVVCRSAKLHFVSLKHCLPFDSCASENVDFV